jgi:hypothetical protein
MVLDADQGIAIFGAGGEVRTATFSPEAGGYRVTGRFLFSAGWQSCSSVTYTDIRVAIDGSGRLVGAGAGEAVSVGGVILPATMSLSGVADRQGATLAIAGASNDPFAAFSVAASEPLPKAARVMLRAPDGETIPLEASGTARGFAATFSKPRVLLRYATQYQVVASDLADLAGNPPIAVGGLVFTTLPRPPLVAEDGFESLADGSTFGGALVLSGSGEPVIAGAKSLYVPVYNSVNTALPVPLVLRLPVGAGDTVVRFSYRAVNGVSGEATYAMGKEGNTIITIGLIDDPVAQTPGTIRGSQVMFGPLRTATVPLPPGTPTDTATEIMFQRSVQPWYGCGSTPAPSIVGGVIIDDLRVE